MSWSFGLQRRLACLKLDNDPVIRVDDVGGRRVR